jgi:2-polyprenyl-3-methyl-5-hydroxy-6-metoxy-1,4-benzoquinol methylase
MAETKMKYELEWVDCGICGSAKQAPFLSRVKELYNGFDEYFDLVECLDCSFIYTNPRPTAATISCFYPDTAKYYQPRESRITDGNFSREKWKRRLQQSVLTNTFRYEMPKVSRFLEAPLSPWLRKGLFYAHVPKFVKSGRLLDIGCSWGGYLMRMQELGWEVYGVDLNAKATEFAREELGLTNVHCGFSDDLNFPDGYFDVVHMSMVLEHLHQPAKALQDVWRLLGEGGQLVLSVPDISGVESRLFKDKFYSLHVPQHLNHFSPQTITCLLERNGFRVERFIHKKSRKDFIESAKYANENILGRIILNPIVKKLVLKPLVNLLSVMGKTSRMSIFAIKKV